MTLDVLVLRASDCRHCGQVVGILERLKAEEFPDLQVSEASIVDHPELLDRFPIVASPGIVVNGKLVASGLVSEKKLRQRLLDAVGEARA